MRFGQYDGDFQSRCSRLAGSLDALHELVQGQDVMLQIRPHPLSHLIDLIASEAHSLLDEEVGPAEEHEQPQGGPLRAVD